MPSGPRDQDVRSENVPERRVGRPEESCIMIESQAPVIDADNHYYEVSDAFTRYLPSDMRRRGLQWSEIDGKRRLLAAEKVTRVLANPTFDPIARPGSLIEYFRAK